MSQSTKVTLRDNNRNILRLNHKNMPDNIVYSQQLSGYALKTDIPSSLSGLIDNNGNITITSDDIVSMYGGDGSYSITEEFRIAEESMWSNVMYELDHNRKWIKTIDGIQANDEGNIDLTEQYIHIDNIDGFLGFKHVQEVSSGNNILATSFNKLASVYYIENTQQSSITLPNFVFDELSENQIKTIQMWVKNGVSVNVFQIPDMFTVIDPDNFPTEFEAGKTAVFVIRFFSRNGKLTAIINYAYSFTETE